MGQRAISLLEKENGNYDVHYTKWIKLEFGSDRFNEENPLGELFRSNVLEINGKKYENVTRDEARSAAMMKDAYTVVIIDRDYEIEVLSYDEI